MNNSLFVIQPYRWNGMWVFDDPAVELEREPFVAGMPEIIDRAVQEIPDAPEGFVLVFSATPFPGATLELEWVREEMEGNWYRWTAAGMEGWLCPALFLYFPTAPGKLYVQVKPRPAGEGKHP
jgi:hypothetical protein